MRNKNARIILSEHFFLISAISIDTREQNNYVHCSDSHNTMSRRTMRPIIIHLILRKFILFCILFLINEKSAALALASCNIRDGNVAAQIKVNKKKDY